MTRTTLSLAGGLATALLLVSAPSAHAAVTAKDAPSQKDIVASFPELADGEFTVDKTKQISVPGSSCGAPTTAKASSAVSTVGVSADGSSVVVTGAAQVKSVAKAKGHLAAYRAYVKKCATFTDPTTGATITTALAKAPRVGQDALKVLQETSFAGITSYSTSVLIRDGKRVASVSATDDAPVSTSSINALAKVAAKKLT